MGEAKGSLVNDADILIVHNLEETHNLIDLDTEDSFDFPFQGTEDQFKQEIDSIRRLLKPSPLTDPLLPPPPPQETLSIHKTNTFVFSHNPQKVRQIQEENQRLVKRLQQVATAPSKLPNIAEEHDRHMANSAAARMTRQRKHDGEIARENLSLYQRLQATKADEHVERNCLEKKYRMTRKYASHISMKRRAPPPPPPGFAPKQDWNNRWHMA